MEVLRQHRLTEGLTSMQATGGGAHKYRKTFEQRLGVGLVPCNELDAVVLGMCLMCKAVPDECYTFERVADPAAADSSASELAQPVVIPSESLGISQPLRKIHRPFCARSARYRHRHGRLCALERERHAPIGRAPCMLVDRSRCRQLTRAKTSSSLSCCATWARASPFCTCSRRRTTRAYPARLSAAAPFWAFADCSPQAAISRTRSTLLPTATRAASICSSPTSTARARSARGCRSRAI